MKNASPSPIQPPKTTAEPPREPPGREPAVADAAMSEYVGYLAGWFDLGRLAAGRRLSRSGVDQPLLTDA